MGGVVNTGVTVQAGNVAVGNRTNATLSSTEIKNSDVKGLVVNTGVLVPAGNLAAGNQTEATMSSTKIEGSKVIRAVLLIPG